MPLAYWTRSLARAALLAATIAAVACAREADRGPSTARKIHVIEGLAFPESVRYDPAQDLYFVSSMNGPGSVKDANGYISRISAGDLRHIDAFIHNGLPGVRLDAPKGMDIQGDTLWVADIDVLRGFDRRNGRPLASIDLRPHGAVLLNDVAVGPDGSIHVTDTGIVMSNIGVLYRGGEKIFVIGPGHAVSLLAEGAGLKWPNGITWDPEGKRWLVVSFDLSRSELYALRPGVDERQVLAEGVGRFDGIERLADGRMLVTSWSDSSLHVITEGGHERMIENLWQPADLGVDTRRGRVAIPLVLQGRVEFWEIPEA